MSKTTYKTVEVNIFDLASIDAAIAELEKVKAEDERRINLFLKKLAERGVEIAQSKVISMDAVFTGELFDSIHAEERANNEYAIIAGSEHAIYVEMGTGIVGAQNPYKGKFKPQYAQGKTIHYIADGRYGWFYPFKGGWKFTEGMPSRPFMYETAAELRKIAKEVAKEMHNA